MELRFERTKTTDAFVAELRKVGVKLPLRVSDEDIGVVLDADGRDVLAVDVNSERPDDLVEAIAMWIVCAVNTCGGFRVEPRQ